MIKLNLLQYNLYSLLSYSIIEMRYGEKLSGGKRTLHFSECSSIFWLVVSHRG